MWYNDIVEREVIKLDRSKAYGIVISEFIKAIKENKDNEELTEDLWHCVAQMEKIKAKFDN